MQYIVIIIISSLAGFIFHSLSLPLFTSSYDAFLNILSIDLFILGWAPAIIVTAIAAYFGRSFSLKQFLIVIFLSQLGYSLLNSSYGPDGVFVDQATCGVWNYTLQHFENKPPSLSCVLITIWHNFSFIFIPFWSFAFTFFFIWKQASIRN